MPGPKIDWLNLQYLNIPAICCLNDSVADIFYGKKILYKLKFSSSRFSFFSF